jgi:hypothetical protein
MKTLLIILAVTLAAWCCIGLLLLFLSVFSPTIRYRWFEREPHPPPYFLIACFASIVVFPCIFCSNADSGDTWAFFLFFPLCAFFAIVTHCWKLFDKNWEHDIAAEASRRYEQLRSLPAHEREAAITDQFRAYAEFCTVKDHQWGGREYPFDCLEQYRILSKLRQRLDAEPLPTTPLPPRPVCPAPELTAEKQAHEREWDRFSKLMASYGDMTQMLKDVNHLCVRPVLPCDTTRH